MNLPFCILLIGQLMCFTACKDSGTEPKEVPFVGTIWKLESFESVLGEVESLQGSRVYSIEFTSDTTVTIRADCNWCTGTYTSHPDNTGGRSRLTFFTACTLVYCGQESHEKQFLKALWQVGRYTVRGNLLRIYYDNDTKVLNLRAQQ